jgi:hypothetical protein
MSPVTGGRETFPRPATTRAIRLKNYSDRPRVALEDLNILNSGRAAALVLTQAVHEGLDGIPRDPPCAADPDRLKLPRTEQFVDLRPRQTEHLCNIRNTKLKSVPYAKVISVLCHGDESDLRTCAMDISGI